MTVAQAGLSLYVFIDN